MRWSVVSLVSGQSDEGLRDAYDPTRRDSRGNVEPLSGDLASAKEASSEFRSPRRRSTASLRRSRRDLL
jgi:hypothetical protein